MLPVGFHLRYGRARQQSTPGPGKLLADSVVVGIEQHFIARFGGGVACQVGLEQEGLEEPGRVRQVPFGRAGKGFGLQAVVLDAQRPAEGQGLGSSVPEVGQQRLVDPGGCVNGSDLAFQVLVDLV